MWVIIKGSDLQSVGLNRGAIQKIEGFRDLINGFSARLCTDEAYDLAIHIVKASGIMSDLKADSTYESISRMENIEELLNSIREFSDSFENGTTNVTLDKYLENVALLTDADTDKPEDRDKVSLMTIHSAKGLEFDYVFVAGVEEDLFPSKMALVLSQELEEERRLFYVAITRAGQQATISYAAHRYKWGIPTICSPSRFIKDIDEKYVELPESIEKDDSSDFDFNNLFDKPKEIKPRTSQTVKSKSSLPENKVVPLNLNKKLVDMRTASRKQSQQNDSFDADDPSKIKAGMTVYHQQFGNGKIVNIEGNAPNIKAVVFFESAGEKKLLLKFARLKIVE